MAKAISAAHTSIPNYLDKLIAEEMLKGTRANPTVSVDGINLLSEFWPAQFTATQQEKFVQDDDSPFWTSLFSPLFILPVQSEQTSISAGCGLFKMNNQLNAIVHVHPLLRGWTMNGWTIWNKKKWSQIKIGLAAAAVIAGSCNPGPRALVPGAGFNYIN